MKRIYPILLICGFLSATAQTSFTKAYIMAYHSCSSCASPMNHTVRLAESNDGINWTAVSGFNGYQGSVPDPIINNNKLYIYTPGKVMRYDNGTQTWDPAPVNVSIVDSAGNTVSYVDPSGIIDTNGRINLFFLNSTGITGDPAQCTMPPCIRHFDSAVEVAGSDGTQFVTQSGHRATYTVTGNFGPTDPDIFFDGTDYFMYVSQGTSTFVHKGSTLHGSYPAITSIAGANVLTNNAGIPCGMYMSSNGNYYSYGHGNNSGLTEVRAAVHSNFNSAPTYTTIITGTSAGLGSTTSVASPGICDNTFSPVGIKNVNHDRPFLFPNPAQESITINSVKEFFGVRITDITGKVLMEFEEPATRYRIDLSYLDKGLYFAEIITATGKTVQKFIKN